MKSSSMWPTALCLCIAFLSVDGTRLVHRIKTAMQSGSQETNDASQGISSNLVGTSQKRAQCKVGSQTVDTFENVALKAAISPCYTVLTKDCSDPEQPTFAVLMKRINSDSEEKKLRIITSKMMIEIESKGENQMKLLLNERAFKIENGTVLHQSDKGILRDHGIHVKNDTHDRQAVIVDLGKLSVKFNGFQAKIQLSDDYKDVLCGICGNLNDNAEEEVNANDNELAENVQKSYTVQDYECQQEQQQQPEDPENISQNQSSDESGEEWNDEVEPVPRTMIKETTSKVCFSQKQVKQCPKGSYPIEEEDTQLLKRKKVSFSCFDRHSLEAKRLKSEVRRFGIADIADFPPSFEEEEVIPGRCVSY